MKLKQEFINLYIYCRTCCELCASKFVRKDAYKRHILTQHPELDDDERNALVEKIRRMKVQQTKVKSS